jgi:hypothetical protein
MSNSKSNKDDGGGVMAAVAGVDHNNSNKHCVINSHYLNHGNRQGKILPLLFFEQAKYYNNHYVLLYIVYVVFAYFTICFVNFEVCGD